MASAMRDLCKIAELAKNILAVLRRGEIKDTKDFNDIKDALCESLTARLSLNCPLVSSAPLSLLAYSFLAYTTRRKVVIWERHVDRVVPNC